MSGVRRPALDLQAWVVEPPQRLKLTMKIFESGHSLARFHDRLVEVCARIVRIKPVLQINPSRPVREARRQFQVAERSGDTAFKLAVLHVSTIPHLPQSYSESEKSHAV